MDQNEIERLLNQSKQEGERTSATPQDDLPAGGGGAGGTDADHNDSQALDQGDIESLLSGAGAKPAEAEAPKPQPESAPENKPQAAPAASSVATEGDDDKLLDQNDIEKLLSQAGKAPAGGQANASKKPQSTKPESGASNMPGDGQLPQQDLDYLLNQAQQALESIDSGEPELPPGVSAFRLDEFPGAPASTDAATLDLIRDVELDMKIELGRTHMYLEDVLKLRKGSVVPLDKLAGDPVDIYVNGRLIARGEVLVLNDNFCVRVAELIAGVHQF